MSCKKDDSGFYAMRRKMPESIVSAKAEKHKKEEKSVKMKKFKPIKFKKGSRKYRMYNVMMQLAISPRINRFHNQELHNFALYEKKGGYHVVASHGSFLDSGMDKIEKHGAIIFLNGGSGFFMKLTLKTYLKMLRIRRVMVHYELKMLSDGTICEGNDEYETVTEFDRIIDSANELVRFYLTERTRIETVCDLHATTFWYDVFSSEYRIMVQFADGDVKYYKDINDFFMWLGMSVI